MAANLRAVSADESTSESTSESAAKPKKTVKPKTLEQAIAGGVYLEILEAQQRDIATSIGEEKGPAKAALHRQFALISKEIQQLRAEAKKEAEENGHGAPEDEPLDPSTL